MLPDGDSMTAADAFLKEYTTPNGKMGCRSWRGGFWFWEDGKWVVKNARETTNRILLKFTGVTYVSDSQKIKTLGVGAYLAQDILRCVEARSQVLSERMPTWLNGDEEFDERFCVGFEDVVVCVKGGEIKTKPRTEDFFGRTLPCKWDPEAKCETWDRCQKQWSGGDPTWVELDERVFGKCLFGWFEARGLLQYGKVRAGKGTKTHLLSKFKGPGGVVHRDVNAFSGTFGLAGLETADVLVLTEFNDLDTASGEAAASKLKCIWGDDPSYVNGKYAIPGDVQLKCMVIMQSNQIPTLPNKGQGLSSKLLFLPHNDSFLNREDPELEEKLWAERAGIAARWVKAAARLQASKAGEKWPKPHAALAAETAYAMENNPLELFLNDAFVRDPEGLTQLVFVRSQYNAWCGLRQIPKKHNEQYIVNELIKQTSWPLVRVKDGQGRRMLKGLRTKKITGDTILTDPEPNGT